MTTLMIQPGQGYEGREYNTHHDPDPNDKYNGNMIVVLRSVVYGGFLVCNAAEQYDSLQTMYFTQFLYARDANESYESGLEQRQKLHF